VIVNCSFWCTLRYSWWWCRVKATPSTCAHLLPQIFDDLLISGPVRHVGRSLLQLDLNAGLHLSVDLLQVTNTLKVDPEPLVQVFQLGLLIPEGGASWRDAHLMPAGPPVYAHGASWGCTGRCSHGFQEVRGLQYPCIFFTMLRS